MNPSADEIDLKSLESALHQAAVVEGFSLSAKELSVIQGDPNPPDRDALIAALDGVGWIDGVISSLKSDPELGIREVDLSHRISVFGENVCPKPPIKSFCSHCQEALEDFILRVLVVAGVASIVLESSIERHSDSWIEGFAVLMAVTIVTCFTSANNWLQDKRFRHMEEIDEKPKYQVTRNGVQITLQDVELLTGDLVSIKSGQQIPSDGLLVSETDLKVNESSFTGETLPLDKSREYPFLYSSSEVVSGNGTMLVTSVGINSAYGRILSALVKEREPTPLQNKLEKVALLVGKFGTGVALVMFIVLMGFWIAKSMSEGSWDGFKVLRYFMVCITIIVVAVPEGLPLAVTVSLAYSLGQMHNDKNLVKQLSACETMGNVTTICSDKTGTLTQNMMTVTRFFVLGAPSKSEDSQFPVLNDISQRGKQLVIEACAINNDCFYDEDAQPNSDWKQQKPERWKWENGNQTDCAMMAWMHRCGVPVSTNKERPSVRKAAGILIDSQPFDSKLKRSSIILAYDVNNAYVPAPSPVARSPSKIDKKAVATSAYSPSVGMFSVPEDSSAASSNPKFQGIQETASGRLDHRRQDSGDASSAPSKAALGSNSIRAESLAEILEVNSVDAAPMPGSPTHGKSQHRHTMRSSTLQGRESISMYRRCIKGASERILGSCSTIRLANDKICPLGEASLSNPKLSWRQTVLNEINEMASSGLRTVAFAYRDISHSELRYNESKVLDPDVASDDGTPSFPAPSTPTLGKDISSPRLVPSEGATQYVFLGVVGIMDPLRHETFNSVRSCQKAGVIVRMVTGDHVDTARYIAQDCGIYTSDLQIVIEASEFSSIYASREEVFARIKELLVGADSLAGVSSIATIMPGFAPEKDSISKSSQSLVASPSKYLSASQLKELDAKYAAKSARVWVQGALKLGYYTQGKYAKLDPLETDLHNISSKLDAMVPNLRVMARSQPQDKEFLVSWLKEHNEVVAVTGDGTNDAPALNEAHIGLAMGSGTAVAKRAAGIVIIDDNFHSIVKSVMWGRSVYDNIRKFVQFQLTINIVALSISLIGAFTGRENPLSTIQLLWVNLLMDTMAALALGTEKPTMSLLERRPFRPSSNLISRLMWRNILGHSILQLAILCIVLFQPMKLFTSPAAVQICDCVYSNATIVNASVVSLPTCSHYCSSDEQSYQSTYKLTLLFNTFVAFQLFNEFNARKVNEELNVFGNLFSNFTFWILYLLSWIFQFLMVQYLGSFANTVGLTGKDWGICIALGALSIPWGLVVRLIPIGAAPEDSIEINPTAFAGAHLTDEEFDNRLVHQNHINVERQRKKAAKEEASTITESGIDKQSDARLKPSTGRHISINPRANQR